MNYKNIIFDFDGTLADTATLIVKTMRLTIDSLNLPPRTDAECKATIGYRLEDIPGILWPDIPDLSQLYVDTYREIFNTRKDEYHIQLYPHVLETLKALRSKGKKMAIASSRSTASLQEYCTKIGIADCFSMLVGGSDVANGKPNADPVNLIITSRGWNKNETLVVGDMNVYILMGKRAGVATCGVTYGNGTAAELEHAGADYIISDFSELLDS